MVYASSNLFCNPTGTVPARFCCKISEIQKLQPEVPQCKQANCHNSKHHKIALGRETCILLKSCSLPHSVTGRKDSYDTCLGLDLPFFILKGQAYRQSIPIWFTDLPISYCWFGVLRNEASVICTYILRQLSGAYQ